MRKTEINIRMKTCILISLVYIAQYCEAHKSNGGGSGGGSGAGCNCQKNVGGGSIGQPTTTTTPPVVKKIISKIQATTKAQQIIVKKTTSNTPPPVVKKIISKIPSTTKAQQIIVKKTTSNTPPLVVKKIISKSPSATKAPQIVKKTTSKSDDDITCGTRVLLGRVVGGSYAQPGHWPWHIGIKSCATCMYFCGGTIVAKKWVITAAHCLTRYRASELYIDAGVTDQGKITKHKQSFRCTTIYTHQSYAINAPFDQDIAVLHLNKEVHFNDHVRPLCLNENRLKAPQSCTVTGFGRTSAAGPKSAKLKQANLPIVAQDVCVKSYNQTKPPRPVTKNMVCAGFPNGGTDACGGDSGGPLSCWDRSKMRHVLGGIVSWGVGCARAKHYGVYTDVEHLTAWITRITGKIQ